MSHQIVLEIPDDVYQALQEQAQKAGKRPEEIVKDWLTRTIQLRQDPLRRYAGVIASGLPDAAERHHEYLGRGFLSGYQGSLDG